MPKKKSVKRRVLRVSITEVKVLILLADNPEGLFASQLLYLSNGSLKRGTIYALLSRLANKEMVEVSTVEASQEHNIDRPLYQINELGLTAIRQLAAELSFRWLADPANR